MRTIAVTRRTMSMLVGAMAFTVAAAGSAAAQSPSDAAMKSGTVKAEATIVQAITVTPSDLAFGEVAAGTIGDIKATDANAAKVTIEGGPGENVEVTFDAPAKLTGPGADITITWSGKMNTGGTQAASSDADLNFGAAAINSGTLDANGKLFLFIGGKIEPPANQKRGTYTADLTIDVKYPGT